MHKFASAFIAAAVVSCAGAASAQDYRIAIGDLNLSTAQGASTFDSRVRSTARRACRNTGSLIADMQCVNRFKAEAMRQLPPSSREDYVRARDGGRILAQVPVFVG